MLWTVFVILLVLWLLGMVSSYTLGGLIHILLVIGLILGKLAEGSFHQALMISDHNYSVFILRPLCAAIFGICLVLVLWPGVKKRLGHGGAEVT